MPVRTGDGKSPDVYSGRILLYDIDCGYSNMVAESLRYRGYICSVAGSKSDCLRLIGSRDFKHLFIGRCEDNLRLFDVIDCAKRNNVDIHPYDAHETEATGQVTRIAHQIENIILLSRYSGKPA
jgi:hypothetical protein